MKKASVILKKIITAIMIVVLLLTTIFIAGRYGWKLFGFSVCESAGIEQINVEEGHVRIRGFYPGSFPRGFLGYHAEQIDSTLYVGFRFSGLFGICETGDFDISIPTKGTVTQIVVKSGEHEYTVWPKEEELFVSEAEATENGIYVRLERSDVVDAGLNFLVKDVSPEMVGYAVDDLDDDGTAEFIIGTIYGDEFYGKLIFVLYTLDNNGDPVQIFSSTERDRYYYAGGIRFANLGASAFDDSFVTTLKLEGDGLVDMTFIIDPADYVQMELVPIV